MICLTPTLPLHITRASLVKFHGKQKEKEEISKFQFQFRIRSCASSKHRKMMKSSNTKSLTVPVPPTPLLLTSGALKFINAFVLMLVLPFKRRTPKVLLELEEKPEPKERKALGMRIPWKRSNSVVKKSDVGTRREIAIKRVLEDDDKRCIRDYSLFVTSRGDTLFTQSWTPVSIDIKGLVVLLHGLNEHSGRYSDFAKQLNANGYKVYGMDWIGHGGSDQLHAYVHSIDDAVKDLKYFLKKVVGENPKLPCFCFGHSTGAAIVLKVSTDTRVQTLIKGIILTSPAVRVQPSHPIFGVIAPLLSFLLPKYQLSAANKKRVPVSRDPEALIAKYSDPLVYTGFIRARTGSEILGLTYYLQRMLNRITAPFLVLHGTADTVTDPEASQKLYEEASSTDKSIKLYDGYLHDLLFEPEKETIAEDITAWMNCRVST